MSENSAKSRFYFMNNNMRNLMRETRKNRGISQETLGKLVSCSGLYISRLERGVTIRVYREVVCEIEKALGLPEDSFFNLIEEKDPNNSNTRPTQSRMPQKKAAPQKKGYCRICGHHLYEDSNFCTRCGTPVLE